MMALSVAYQRERQNVEADDVTAVVSLALGMILGKTVRDESDVSGVSGIKNKRCFFQTALITAASQKLIEVFELDVDLDLVTTRREGRVMKKMRFFQLRNLMAVNGDRRSL